MDLDRVFFVVTAIAGVKESLNWSFPIVALGLILCAYDFNWKFQIHYCFIHHNDVNAVSIDTCIAWQWCVRNFYNKNNLFVCLQEVTSLLCLLSITRCGPQMIKYFSQRHKLHQLEGLYELVSYKITYLPVYSVHFFPAEKALKIEMHIIHRILCFRLVSLISM